jgi:hypothetical protein
MVTESHAVMTISHRAFSTQVSRMAISAAIPSPVAAPNCFVDPARVARGEHTRNGRRERRVRLHETPFVRKRP